MTVGSHELVGLAALVGRGDGVGGARRREAVAVDERVVGELDAVPARVAVHGVVAAADGGDSARSRSPSMCSSISARYSGRAPRRRVAAVEEGVHDEVGHALAARQVDARLEVAEVGVHAAVRDETHEVERGCPSPALWRRPACRTGFSKKRAVVDRLADARQVLVDDAAGADVEVADLGVAHLPGGQADGRARRVERAVRVGRPEPVEDRRVGERHGVARSAGCA